MEIPLNFSLTTTLLPDVLEIRKSIYSNEKYKDILIIYENKLLKKFHSLLFDDEELKHIEEILTSSNELIIPKQFPERFIDIIVNYFYFKEIQEIAIKEIFYFLEMVIFLKLNNLKEKIRIFFNEFLDKNDEKIGIFCINMIFKYDYSEKSWRDWKIYQDNLKALLIFFQKSCYQEFLNIFKSDYFEYDKLKIKEIFLDVLQIMRSSHFKNQEIFQFLLIFKDKFKDFHFELSLCDIIEQCFDFSKLNLHELEKMAKSLGILDINDLKFKLLDGRIQNNNELIELNSKENANFKFMIEKLINENEILSINNKKLKQSVKLLSEEKMQLQQKFNEMTIKTQNDFDDIKQTIKEIDLINHPFQAPEPNDHLNFLLFQYYQQNLQKKILFDSNFEKIDVLSNRISGQKNVVFHFETKENIGFGAYFSIELPKPFGEDKYYQDKQAFIFDLEKNQYFKAVENEEKQLRTFKGYVYCFGDSKKGDGIEFKDLNIITIGKKTEQFEGENLYGYDKREQRNLKRVRVYKIII